MHYKKLEFTNIKGRSGGWAIPPLTIVSGPNGSGKSAFLEAMRLAATGRCSLGASRSAIAAICSSSAASAALHTDDVSNVFSVSIGDTVSIGGGREDLQGGMPVTVGDMWDLTAEQRLSLVVSKETLEYNARDTQWCRDRAKALKQLIDTPQPAAPRPYSGPSVFELDEEIRDLTIKIAEHAKRKREAENWKAENQRLIDAKSSCESIIAQHSTALRNLAESRAHASSAVEWLHPTWLKEYETVQESLEDMLVAMEWLRFECGLELGDAISSLNRLLMTAGEPRPMPKPSCVWPESMPEMAGKCPVEWLEETDAIYKGIETRLRIEENLLASVMEKISEMPPEPEHTDGQLVEEVVRLDALKEMSQAAYEWTSFERRTKEWAEQRGKAVAELDEVKARLEALTKERAAIVNKLKGNIEGRANDMLSRVGLSPLEIDIETTAQKASLKVSVAGVAIEAMAASEKLLYGICLLLAIQQASDAKCPILVAECAETDEAMFNRLVGAIGEPEKGNVVLEHWMKTPGSIYMGCE